MKRLREFFNVCASLNATSLHNATHTHQNKFGNCGQLAFCAVETGPGKITAHILLGSLP